MSCNTLASCRKFYNNNNNNSFRIRASSSREEIDGAMFESEALESGRVVFVPRLDSTTRRSDNRSFMNTLIRNEPRREGGEKNEKGK